MAYVELFWDIYNAINKVATDLENDHYLYYGIHGPEYRSPRWWWQDLVSRFDAHPAVLGMMERGYRPDDMHLLVLQ